MKKVLVALLAAGVVSLFGVSSVRAEDTMDHSIVKVPFSFIVGNKLLPAGTYRIEAESDAPTTLVIQSTGRTSATAFAETDWAGDQPSFTSQKVRVQFKNYDGRYFLSQVVMPGEDARVIPLTERSAEHSLTALNLMPTQFSHRGGSK
jgi:hypothetical protein